MPFTASHVAAVLPLVRTPLLPSALVVGSMVPDLPYFLPLPLTSYVTHSPVGVVSVDALMGLAVVIWHRSSRLAAPAAPGLRIPRQYASTLVGAAVLAGWLVRSWRRTPPCLPVAQGTAAAPNR
jgi:hypothetical protein